MAARFTVMGARGYVGGHLTRYLRSIPETVVLTDEQPLPPENLGHVFFCIGVTTDFRSRLNDTMRAHVGKALEQLEEHAFESFTYLSSTRVYERGSSGDEAAVLTASPADAAEYYKISKIAGEAVCLTHPNPSVRVVRLSNVLGMEWPPITFIPTLIRDALLHRRIVLRTALDSAKDYVMMDDVVRILPRIAMAGQRRVYNVASGRQTTHEELVKSIAEVIPCELQAAPDTPRLTFPDVSIELLRQEFSFQPGETAAALRPLCAAYSALRESI